jgi:hypothetical protein
MLKQYRLQNLIQRVVTNLVSQQKSRMKRREILNALYTFDMRHSKMIESSFNRWRETIQYYSKISSLVSTTYDDIFITNKIFAANQIGRRKLYKCN